MEQLKESNKKNGEFELVVAWVHSAGKNVLNIISEVIPDNGQPWRLFHILGSRANLGEVNDQVHMNENCLYRQVQLGFVIEGEISSWLTMRRFQMG